MMSRLHQRSLTNQRADNGLALPAETTRRRRTKSVPRTESGRLLPKGVALKVSEALENYSEGEVATILETNKDTAQAWKLGRRAPNSSALLGMMRGIDEVGMLMAEEADLGRFFGHEGHAMKILRELALQESA